MTESASSGVTCYNFHMALNSNSKLEKVRVAMRSGDWSQAIRLAAKFPTLGIHKEAIRRANDALNNPEIYTELGYDLNAVMQAGVEALQDRFSQSWAAVKFSTCEGERNQQKEERREEAG